MTDLDKVRALLQASVRQSNPYFHEGLETVSLEDLVTYAESVPDMSEANANALRMYIGFKLIRRWPDLFSTESMKHHYRALLPEEDRDIRLARRGMETIKDV